MSTFATKFNTPSAHFDFEITEKHEFVKPSHLVVANTIDHVYPLKGLYISKKGKFGDEAVLITDTCLVNAPQYLTDNVKEILQDDLAVKAINDGLVGFTFYEYEHKVHGNQFAVKWVDIPPVKVGKTDKEKTDK